MLKLYETLSLEDAAIMIDESPKSASKLKKRLRDTMRKRMKTLERHGLKNTEGYRWMELAMRESLGPVNPMTLSRMTNILGSRRTSVTGLREIWKKAIETINLEFGLWKKNPKTGEQILASPFIKNVDEFAEFSDLMQWYRDNVQDFRYTEQQKEQLEQVWKKAKSNNQSWREVKQYLEEQKEKYYDRGEQPDLESIINKYVGRG